MSDRPQPSVGGGEGGGLALTLGDCVSVAAVAFGGALTASGKNTNNGSQTNRTTHTDTHIQVMDRFRVFTCLIWELPLLELKLRAVRSVPLWGLRAEAAVVTLKIDPTLTTQRHIESCFSFFFFINPVCVLLTCTVSPWLIIIKPPTSAGSLKNFPFFFFFPSERDPGCYGVNRGKRREQRSGGTWQRWWGRRRPGSPVAIPALRFPQV